MSYWCVPPPAQGDWYDLETVVTDVLARLRLSEADPDEPRIRELVPVAATQINVELDRVYPMTPAGTADTTDIDEDEDVDELLDTNVTPTILSALSQLTIELYRRGRSDTAGNQFQPIGAPIDAVIEDLAPHKARWGFA